MILRKKPRPGPFRAMTGCIQESTSQATAGAAVPMKRHTRVEVSGFSLGPSRTFYESLPLPTSMR